MTTLTNTLRTLALGAALVASQVQAELYYFHNDHLGTPQVVTDTAGDVVWEGQYSPFGEVVETTADVQQDLRFPGQLLDRETGLHYNYFRDYDPGTGRYVESDPIGLQGGKNLFAYSDLAPTRYSDEFGLKPSETGIITTICRIAPLLCPSPENIRDRPLPPCVHWDKETCVACCIGRNAIEFIASPPSSCSIDCIYEYGAWACGVKNNDLSFS